MKPTRIIALGASLAVLALAACGQSEEERQREEAVDALADIVGREAAEDMVAAGEEAAAGAETPEEALRRSYEAMMDVRNGEGEGEANPSQEATGQMLAAIMAAAAGEDGSDLVANAPGTGLDGSGFNLNPDAAASGGRHDYRGETPGLSLPVEYGGPIHLEAATMYRCTGFFGVEPSAEIDYRGGDGDLFISGMADQDTTLAIRGPDGLYYCNDDAWGGLNPAIRFSGAQRGIYQVWLGRYGVPAPGEGQVFISTTGPGPQR